MVSDVRPLHHESSPSSDGIYVKPEAAAWGILAVGVLLSLLTANPLLTAASLLVVPVLIVLLWRQGEAPVLLFAATYQWVQVSTKVFHANLYGMPVAELGITPTVETATWLSLLSLVILALGMRLALRKAPPPRNEEARSEAEQVPFSRALAFYLVCLGIGVAARAMAWVSPGFTQPAIAIEGMRWIGFFVFGYVVMAQRRGYPYLLLAIVFEFVQGIGFFAGFKTVIFVAGIVVFTVYPRLTGRTVALGLTAVAGLLILGSAWTSVKTEYRAFLNQGSQQQVTVVSREEQLYKLVELVGGLSAQDIELAMYPLMERMAYVDFFGAAMDYVPAVVEHQEGTVWREAVVHALVPRLLYPDKPVLVSDSEHTMRYTGLYMASDDQGTSISLGYVADSYVDFGPVWMYVPVFLVGLLWGLMYRYFISRGKSALLASAFAVAALIAAYKFEVAAIKLVAGVTVKFLVLAVVMKFVEPRMMRFLGIEAADLSDDAAEDYAAERVHA